MNLPLFYEQLLARYGPQGWWPVQSASTADPDTPGFDYGYHPADYTFPHNPSERFEICAGAILTQNTAWSNAARAVWQLRQAGAMDPQILVQSPPYQIAEFIRPAGYYNQKTRKLREFADFFLRTAGAAPDRNDLLSLWGIGPETADSILLYAFSQPEMVIDNYTIRILTHHRLLPEKATYGQAKAICTGELPREVTVYQEFHALIVHHAKQHYQRAPYADPLLFSPA